MSEPTRTSAAKRTKLAAALKRNMARRKEVVGRQSVVVSEEGVTTQPAPKINAPQQSRHNEAAS